MRAGVDVVLAFCIAVLMAPQALATERWVPSQYPTIQAAIDACVDGDEVIVEPNTYTGDGNRDLDPNGKAITVRSIDPNDPNVVAATIISCNPDGLIEPNDPNYEHRGFYFHSGEDANSVVAGLTITNGYAYEGGAIFCEDDASPTITHCTMTGNQANYGGGIYCFFSSPKITRCTIRANTAPDDGGGGICCCRSSPTITRCSFADNSGSGIWCTRGGDATITWCSFISNSAGRGGGIRNLGSGPSVANCTFRGNSALTGGGILNDVADPNVTNCTFIGNSAGSVGGGMYSSPWDKPTVANCTFIGNSAGSVGGGIYSYMSSMTMTNCILWANGGTDESSQIYELYSPLFGSAVVVNFSCIQGCSTYCTDPNDQNIGADPNFVDPNGPDGDPNTWADNDYHLSAGSPCINTGDPNGSYGGQIDVDGEPRVMGRRVDMGSDEYPSCALTIAVNWDPLGTVDVNPNQPTYPLGTTVTLTAFPNDGCVFVWWLGDVPVAHATDNPLQLTIDADKSVYCVLFFEERPTCGSGVAPMLLMTLGVLGLIVLPRRRQ